MIHFKKKDLKCDLCDYRAPRIVRIMMHMKNFHKLEIDSKYEKGKNLKKCNNCGSMVMNLRRHGRNIHPDVHNFICDACPFGSFLKRDMEVHVLRFHKKKAGRSSDKFCCEVCGLSFEKKFHLNAHNKVKHKYRERNFLCDICHKSEITNSPFPGIFDKPLRLQLFSRLKI